MGIEGNNHSTESTFTKGHEVDKCEPYSMPTGKDILKNDLFDEEYSEEIYVDDEGSDEGTIKQQICNFLPSLKKRWKTVLAAIILFLLGIIFLLLSIINFLRGDWMYGSSMIFLSFICGVPGGIYQSLPPYFVN